ncbi:MAG TPA: NUDIX hydrolase [Longimicrobium sp.]|jgi:8-oxo-dGTP pyrophosphatase MutT (NUDIX family)|uniref:NUDIX hydrolase n=1 Tax=Longimicrobium sp. TaxID=2029185 RepID=UPI002EDBAEDA
MQGEEKGAPRPWPMLAETELQDYEIFRARRIDARSPEDGSEHTFHVADAPDGVLILALTPDGRMVMVRQWRHPLQRITLELPAGIIEEGEEPAAAAARELREETGYEGDAARMLPAVVLNPSWQTTRLHTAVIANARPVGEKELDDAEDTRVCLLAPDQLRARVMSGDADSAPVVTALALWEWSGRPGLG